MRRSSGKGLIPFDSLPNAVDPPSGFLATANSRVTTDSSPYPLTLEWTDPYRAERIYKLLDGRSGLAPKDMLAVQTDIYSDMDQEFGQRLAYAIDHTEGVDARLRQAADLMRSWDGRLATDSAAASLVTQARRVLWPLILEPKLGKLAADYRWEESNFAEEEIVMHAKADWLPPGYKNWDALLTDAVRKGDGGRQSACRCFALDATGAGTWWTSSIRWRNFCRSLDALPEPAPRPQSGDTTTVKQVGRDFGPSQRFTMDWNNMDGSTENIVLGESSDPYSPLLPRPVERLVRRHHVCASLLRPPQWPRRAGTRCDLCHESRAPGDQVPGLESETAGSNPLPALIGPAVVLVAAALCGIRRN